MNRAATPSQTPRSSQAGDPADAWYFTADQIAHCPSARDGMKRHHIEEKRQRGYDFIMEVSKELNLEIRAKATVMVYFHRFFQLHSFAKFSSTEVAATCLFLGTKVEDFRLPLRECVLVSLYIRSGRQSKYQDTSSEFVHLHKVISNLEMVVLCALRFDFVVEHPYDTVLRLCKNLMLPDDKKNAIAQGAWNFVNDNLGSTLALRFKPGMIAVAALQLSARRCEIPLDWKDLKVMDEKAQADHYEIMHSILEVYEQGQQHQHKKAPAQAPAPSPRAPAGVLTPNPEANSSQSPLGATSGTAPEPLSATSATAPVPAATATKTEAPPPNPPLPQDPPLPPLPSEPLPPPPPSTPAPSSLKADSAKALSHQRPSPYSRPRDADARLDKGRLESKEEGEI